FMLHFSIFLLFWIIAATRFLALKAKQMSAGNEDIGRELCNIVKQHRKDLSKNNFTAIPSDLPRNTQYLDLSYNRISRINSGDLMTLPYLCFLNFAHNGLEFISPTAFQNNSRIQVLNISHNSLKFIPELPSFQGRILDISHNIYGNYTLTDTFRNLWHLQSLSLGSPYARSIHVNDFAALQDIHLKQLSLGAGLGLQNYEHGSFAQLKSLQELTLKMSFCNEYLMFHNVLKDVGKAEIESLKLVKFFPHTCKSNKTDPFEVLNSTTSLSNITFEDTWISSSLMNNIVLNTFKASIQALAFLNITYYEDTVNGVQFKGIPGYNQTARIRVVIFDNVLHYQYRYPQININVSYFYQIVYLKFSGTGMNISPCNLISALPSLEILDLSNNLLNDDGFWWPGCSYINVFPALKHLSLSNNRFVNIAFISDRTQQIKTLESLDLSFNSIKLKDKCSWPSHLIELNLSNNDLGNSVFKYLSSHFKRLNLCKTGITVLSQDTLSMMPNLTHLFLSSNNIRILPADLLAPSLKVLYMDHNDINVVDQMFFKRLQSLKSLNLGNNPLSCSCDSYWFVTALNKTLLVDWPQEYTCSTPPSLDGMLLEDYQPDRLACESWLQATTAIPVTAVSVVVISLVFYFCEGPWYLKMLWVWIRVKRRNYQAAKTLGNASFHYHAFISYSQNDSSWVGSQLVPNLENEGFCLCIHERDFVPGNWIIDNIINCVECSYKTLFVLSQNFIQSEWCNYELFFAQHRALTIHQDSLVFILLEPIPADSLPRRFLKLRTLLRQQTYLEWPKEEKKRQFFWTNLKAMLKTANKHMVMKDVAKDIVDSCPLLKCAE
uniref:TIR domain-containing protein n=1 Tax=Lepisosteus oculatus TaxID=7918 RepID=W5NN05_LEPOC